MRRAMRGYRHIRETNRLDLINRIRHDLENTSIADRSAPASEMFFREALPIAERVVRQYLMARFVNSLPFNRGVLASLVSPNQYNVHIVPGAWRTVLKEHGVPVSEFASMMVWWSALLAAWAYGTVRALLLLYKTRPQSEPIAKRSLSQAAFFDTLSPRNKPRGNGSSHDVLSWYASRSQRDGKITWIAHDVTALAPTSVAGLPVRNVGSSLSRFEDWSQTFRLLVWSVYAVGYAFAGLLTGRWWHALMLSEAARASVAALHYPGGLACEYWFHNSSHIYRPLWTYVAEGAGSQINLYCYSTNFNDFKRPEGYPLQSGNWSLMSWTRFTVWDTYQEAFIQRAVGADAQIEIAGEIPFADSDEELPAIPPDSVAVFDVQPVRPSFYRALGQRLEYYVPRNSSAFLLDIESACRDCQLNMLLKRKREIGSREHPSYKRLVEKLSGNSSGFIAINPDIAAHRVIEAADIVISMPFTSTALIARKLGKPSCFYDANGLIELDDRAAHGIPVIRGREALIEWVRSHKTGRAPERNMKQ